MTEKHASELTYAEKQDWFLAFLANAASSDWEDLGNDTTVIDSFRWDGTPEGHEFWSKINCHLQQGEEYSFDFKSEVRSKYGEKYPEIFV